MKDPIFEEFMQRAQEMELVAGPRKEPEKKKTMTKQEAIAEFNSPKNCMRFYDFQDFKSSVRRTLEKNNGPPKTKNTELSKRDYFNGN
jgi:hypothetical protein